jgi:hypothetical protein
MFSPSPRAFAQVISLPLDPLTMPPVNSRSFPTTEETISLDYDNDLYYLIPESNESRFYPIRPSFWSERLGPPPRAGMSR